MDLFKTIEIKKDDFLPLLKWCLIKFKSDPLSRQSIGGRADKIGGFIDRFSNQCVNWIIFNHLLYEKDFKIDPDFFFYNAKSAKKCADVIGLRGRDKDLVPLSYFIKDQWVHESNCPFIEVKTVRNSQYLVGLGLPQYDDNHYFVYVESEFDDLYLFNFLNNSFLEELDLSMDSIYLKDNSLDIIKSPAVNMPDKLATIRLLGIYKGSDLKNHNLSFKQNEPIRYIKSLEPIKEEDIPPRSKGMKTIIEDDVFIYDPLSENKNQYLPIHTKGNHIEIIHSKKQTKSKIYIKVNKPCHFNEFDLDNGFYEIEFGIFKKSSKEVEIFNHKSIYDVKNYKSNTYPKDCTEELISKLEKIYNERKF